MTDKLQNAVLTDVAFYHSVFNALEANIALLDRQGTILAVNSSWQRFGEANGIRDTHFGVGANYFAVCRAAVDPVARAAANGIEDILSGRQSFFHIEYPCHSPDEERWFSLRATPLADFSNFAVVAHEDITERVIAERAGTQQEQNALLNVAVQRFLEWNDRIKEPVSEVQQFKELCEDYLELAAWIGDHQSVDAGDKELGDARRLLEKLAKEIEYYLRLGSETPFIQPSPTHYE